MFDLTAWQSALGTVVGLTASGILSAIPRVVTSVLTIVLGVILGNWTKTALVKGLGALRLDKLVSDTRFKVFLEKAEISSRTEVVVGTLAKWLVVLVFFIAATNILGLTTVSTLLASILGYIPSVVSAVIVLSIGVFLAGIVEKVVKGALASIDIETSRLMGKMASYLVVTTALLAAFSELKIAASFINILFIGVVAMLSLGLGLALGLGAKDLVSQLLTDWYKGLRRDLDKKK